MDILLSFGAETFFVASAVGSEDGFEEYESRLASSLTVRSSFGDSQPSGRASSDSSSDKYIFVALSYSVFEP